MVSSTSRLHFTPGKDPVPILQEAGWAPGPVWTGRKSRPHRDSIPDCPVRSQSLYRLSYPANIITLYSIIILWDHRRICGPLLTETSLCGAYVCRQSTRASLCYVSPKLRLCVVRRIYTRNTSVKQTFPFWTVSRSDTSASVHPAKHSL